MKRKYLLEIVCENCILQTERYYANRKNALIALTLYQKRHVSEDYGKVIEKSITLLEE